MGIVVTVVVAVAMVVAVVVAVLMAMVVTVVVSKIRSRFGYLGNIAQPKFSRYPLLKRLFVTFTHCKEFLKRRHLLFPLMLTAREWQQ